MSYRTPAPCLGAALWARAPVKQPAVSCSTKPQRAESSIPSAAKAACSPSPTRLVSTRSASSCQPSAAARREGWAGRLGELRGARSEGGWVLDQLYDPDVAAVKEPDGLSTESDGGRHVR